MTFQMETICKYRDRKLVFWVFFGLNKERKRERERKPVSWCKEKNWRLRNFYQMSIIPAAEV